MGLGGYIAKRTFYNVITLLLIAVVNFIIFRLIPANPVDLFANGRLLRPGQVAALTRLYGLDKPLWNQFVLYIYDMLTFQFGISTHTRGDVWVAIIARVPPTILLLGTSITISIILGVLIGVISASRRGGIFDAGVQGLSLFTYALPAFWVGEIFLIVFFVGLHWFPFGGTSSNPPPTQLLDSVRDTIWHLTLPATALVLISVGGWALLMRNSLLEVLSEDYIVTARAKGLPERTVLYRHAARNALLPVVTQVALTFGYILTGAVLTEGVFSWPGLGRYTFESISTLDYPVLQAIFFLIAISVVIANFTADILYGFLDPRIRY